MKITIHQLSGKSVTFEINPRCTVGELIEAASKALNMPAQHFSLLFNKKCIHNGSPGSHKDEPFTRYLSNIKDYYDVSTEIVLHGVLNLGPQMQIIYSKNSLEYCQNALNSTPPDQYVALFLQQMEKYNNAFIEEFRAWNSKLTVSDVDKVLTHYQQALDFNLSSKERSDILFNRTKLYLNPYMWMLGQKRYYLALSDLSDAIQLMPGDTQLLRERALTYMKIIDTTKENKTDILIEEGKKAYLDLKQALDIEFSIDILSKCADLALTFFENLPPKHPDKNKYLAQTIVDICHSESCQRWHVHKIFNLPKKDLLEAIDELPDKDKKFVLEQALNKATLLGSYFHENESDFNSILIEIGLKKDPILSKIQMILECMPSAPQMLTEQSLDYLCDGKELNHTAAALPPSKGDNSILAKPTVVEEMAFTKVMKNESAELSYEFFKNLSLEENLNNNKKESESRTNEVFYAKYKKWQETRNQKSTQQMGNQKNVSIKSANDYGTSIANNIAHMGREIAELNQMLSKQTADIKIPPKDRPKPQMVSSWDKIKIGVKNILSSIANLFKSPKSSVTVTNRNTSIHTIKTYPIKPIEMPPNIHYLEQKISENCHNKTVKNHINNNINNNNKIDENYKQDIRKNAIRTAEDSAIKFTKSEVKDTLISYSNNTLFAPEKSLQESNPMNKEKKQKTVKVPILG